MRWCSHPGCGEHATVLAAAVQSGPTVMGEVWVEDEDPQPLCVKHLNQALSFALYDEGRPQVPFIVRGVES